MHDRGGVGRTYITRALEVVEAELDHYIVFSAKNLRDLSSYPSVIYVSTNNSRLRQIFSCVDD